MCFNEPYFPEINRDKTVWRLHAGMYHFCGCLQLSSSGFSRQQTIEELTRILADWLPIC